MADERTIRVRFLAEIGNYLDGVRKAGAATANFGKEVSGQGTAVKADIEKVGRAALVMSGGMALALGAAAKSAIDWESAWAGVQKTVDESQISFGELEGQLRGLAQELPASHREIAAVAEAAGQLGVHGQSIAEFTRTMIALGETTNLTADDAATAIAQLMNIMQTAPGDVDNLGSALVDLGNKGASTEADILNLGLRLAAAGVLIGATEQEVLALAGAMANLGIPAELGGGAMSRVLRKINSAVLESGEKLEGFAEIANVSAEEFAETWRRSPIEALDLFVGGLGKVKAEGRDITAVLADLKIKGTQELDVIGRLAGATGQLSTALGISNEAWEENRALQEEAARRYGTTEAQLQVLRNKVNDLAIDLGDALLPAIQFVVGALEQMVGFFESLPAGAQTATVAILGVATAGIGIVAMVGTLLPKVRELDKALKTMGLGSDFASRNLGRFATSVAKVGLVTGILFAAGEGIDKLFDRDYGGNATKLERDLIALAEGAALAGDAELDLDALRSAIERIAAPSVATQLEHVGEEIVTLGGLLGESTDDLDAAKERVDGLDKALAGLAQTDPDAAVAALEAIKLALGDQDFARLLPLLDDYEISLIALENAGRTGADGMDPVTQAAEDQQKAIDALVDEIDDLLGRYLSVEGSVDAFWTELNDLNDMMATLREDGFEGLEDPMTSMSDDAIALREHMRGLVEAGADVIRNMLEQGSTQQELDRRMAELSQSFRDQAIAAGVPAPVVDHYLELLEMIPHEVPTTLTVTVDDQTEAAIARIQSRLDALGIHHDPRSYYRPPGASGPYLTLEPQNDLTGTASTGGLVPQHLAIGGRVWGFKRRGTDTVPLMGTPGEYMVREPVVSRLGVPFMDWLNAGLPMPRTGSAHAASSAASSGPSETVILNVQQYPEDPDQASAGIRALKWHQRTKTALAVR